MFCKNCGNQIPDGAAFCSVCGASVNGTDNAPVEVHEPVQPAHPMKWHKFLIYFQLFLAALISLYNAVVCFRLVFLDVSGLWDAVYAVSGVISVVLAVLALYVRFRLAGFRKNGPKMYILFLGINCVFQVLNLLISFGSDLNTVSSAIGSLLTCVLMLVLTNIYYKKRAIFDVFRRKIPFMVHLLCYTLGRK